MNIAPLDLENRDYSFTLTGNSLQIEERAKDRGQRHRAHKTGLRLQECFVRLKEANQGIEQAAKDSLRGFLHALRARVDRKLDRKHPILAPILRLVHSIFRCGPSPVIKSALALLETVQIVQPKEIVQPKAVEIVPAGNKVLFEVFQLQDGKTAENIEKIKASLKNKTALKTLHKHTFSDTSLDILLPLFEKEDTFAKVVKRFKQIERIQIERAPIARGELLRHALFMEWTLATVVPLEDAFYHLTKTGLLNSLQVDGKARNFYVIAHPLRSVLQEKEIDSTFKRVMTGAEVRADHYDHLPEIVACLHTKIEDLTMKTIRQDVKNTHREIEFCREFSGKRGIAEFRTATQFAVKNVPRLSMIFTMRTGNLSNRVFKDPRPITFPELVIVLKDLLAGLATIHTAFAIHADFKPPNILLQMDQRGLIIKAEICDFGIAFRNAGERKKMHLPVTMHVGNYGTVLFTAPELYGNSNFAGDFYALDIWALGAVFYELYYRKQLPWSKLIEEHEKNNFDKEAQKYKDVGELQRAQTALKKCIEAEIEAPFAILARKPKREPAEQYQYIILSMLRLAPEKRAGHAELNQMAACLN